MVGFEWWFSAIICYSTQHKVEEDASCAFAVFALPYSGETCNYGDGGGDRAKGIG